MPYTKHDGAGVIIERSTTTNLDWAGPWETIPGITGDPTLPSANVRTYDATTHDEAASTGFTSKRAQLAEVADVSFECFWDPDDVTHQAVLADMQARTVRDYRVRMYGVTKRYGTRGQVGVGNLRATLNGGLMATITIASNTVNFSVT